MRTMPVLSSLFSISALLLLAYHGTAQQPATPQSPLPTDPKEMLSLVAQSNGLAAQDLQPWHIAISFKLLDGKGNTTDQGSFEEFWAAPQKFKRIFTTSNFSQTEFSTAEGLRRTGNKNAVPEPLTAIANEFVHPISMALDPRESTNLSMHELAVGTTKLSCLSAVKNGSTSPPTPPFDETYCLNDNTPILRIHIRGISSRILRNGIIRFQGKYLPQNVEIYQMGIPQQPATLVVSAHLETAEAIKTVDDVLFVPPPDAIKPPKQISLIEEQARAQLLDHPKPVYPAIAVAAHVSGNVVLAVTIDTEGHVTKIGIIDGPPMLRQAAIDGIKHWTFKPFTEQGEAASVSTVLTLHFYNPELGGMIK